eukprot:11090856-Karenia_brevis.AAC.1
MVQPTSAQGWPRSCCKMVQEDFRSHVLYCDLPGDRQRTAHVLKSNTGMSRKVFFQATSPRIAGAKSPGGKFRVVVSY